VVTDVPMPERLLDEVDLVLMDVGG